MLFSRLLLAKEALASCPYYATKQTKKQAHYAQKVIHSIT